MADFYSGDDDARDTDARTHVRTPSNPKHRPLAQTHEPGGRDGENSSRKLGRADKQSRTLLPLLLERINKGQREGEQARCVCLGVDTFIYFVVLSVSVQLLKQGTVMM